MLSYCNSPWSIVFLIVIPLFQPPPITVIADPRTDPHFCRPFLCGRGQEPVQKWPLSFQSVGCSKMGGIQMFSGAGATMGSEGDPHEVCCDRRNVCLQTCGAIKTTCDEEFFRCTRDVCAGSTEPGSSPESCAQSSKVYELMVKVEGCRQYDAEQVAHCDCITAEEAPQRRRDVLRKFYKKYSPDSLDKVEGLAKKADSPRKMAALLAKLIKKYPRAIQKIKDPKLEMMDRLMKESREKEDRKEEDTVDGTLGNNDDDDEEEGDVQEL